MRSFYLSIRHAVEEAIGRGSKSNRDKLYEAMVASDAAYVQRLKSGYESDDAYHSDIKMALRDNDSRIWEAAVAWNAGDMETYFRIAKEIRGENRFEQDDIVLAIRAEASSMVEKESGNSDKVYGYFTNEKFGVAMGQNNTSMADTIRQDLIDTAMANSKTRDEAEETVRNAARTQLKQLYSNGTITGANAEKMLVKYGGLSRQEAAEKVSTWDFIKKHPGCEDISYAAIESYETYCERTGMNAKVFYDAWKYNYSAKSDKDASGKAINGSMKDKVLRYIHGLNLSYAQKDSLYYAFGWSENTIDEAPWH